MEEEPLSLSEILKIPWPPSRENLEVLIDWSVQNVDDISPKLVELSNKFCQLVHTNDPAEIRPSTIPGANYGLFARRNIEEGERITVYGGALYKREHLMQVYGTENVDDIGEYVIELDSDDETNPDHYAIIDGELGFFLSEQGRWANTQRTKDECNAQFEPERCELDDEVVPIIWVVATRPIERGEEIFVWYSQAYSKHLYSKKPRICIQCNVTPATCKFKSTSLVFCGKECAQQYWSLI